MSFQVDNEGALMFGKKLLLAATASAALLVLVLGACHEAPPQALGTLEFDRITLPAPAAERIVAINVQEGQRVHAGQFCCAALLPIQPPEIHALTLQRVQQRIEVAAQHVFGVTRIEVHRRPQG